MWGTVEADIVMYDWTWNSKYQNEYNRAKFIIKKNMTRAFHHEKQQQYLETDVCSVSLGVSLM